MKPPRYETYVADSDPGVTNAPPPESAVQIVTNTAANPVTIPEYSVVRLERTVFDVPKPAVTIPASTGAQILHWSGLTNVTYNVQAATDLLSSWTTLGKVASAQTNFVFTNRNAGAMQYYRLVVP